LDQNSIDQTAQLWSKKFLKNLELVIVYRILAELGYLSKTGELKFLLEDEINQNLFKKLESYGIIGKNNAWSYKKS
jgi:hypothetical protein